MKIKDREIEVIQFESSGIDWLASMTFCNGKPIKVRARDKENHIRYDDVKEGNINFDYVVKHAIDIFLIRDLEKFVEIYKIIDRESTYFEYMKKQIRKYLQSIQKERAELNTKENLLISLLN